MTRAEDVWTAELLRLAAVEIVSKTGCEGHDLVNVLLTAAVTVADIAGVPKEAVAQLMKAKLATLTGRETSGRRAADAKQD